MKTFLKLTFIFLGFVVIAGILFVRSISRKTEDVREMCRIPPGTSIEDVMAKARSLSFSEQEQGALGRGIVVWSPLSKEAVWQEDSLPGVEEGKIVVGKVSLPPFMRNYCELTFKARKVLETRTYTID